MMYTLQLAVIFMVEAFSQAVIYDFILLEAPYTFPGNASLCQTSEWRKSFPTKATIATYQNQIFWTEEEFTWKENHLLLNSARYTDQGRYVFVCNGDEKTLKLDVLYALNVHVAEMDNITLKCLRRNANDVTWLHNNERVLQYKKDGSINPGKGYEGRVSLEKNCFKTGDISLTITGVRKTDAGIYRCFVDDETTEGYPHTYDLSHVNEKRSSPGNQKDSNCNEAQSNYKWLFIVFVIISIFMFILMLVIVIPKLNCRSTSDTDTNREENVVELLDKTTLPKKDSQSMDNHPVQESDTTENKPSNTKPF